MTSNRWASKRTQAMPQSIFALMNDAKQEAKEKGFEIIDLSIGSSDLKPPKAALEALKLSLDDETTYGYCLQSGTKPLRDEVAAWYKRRYQHTVCSNKEVLPLIGSQEGFANLLFAVSDPGDSILLPDPAYASYFGAVALAGLNTLTMPLKEEHDFLPDLSAIPSRDAAKAKLMVISYPNNPTAAVATETFMQEVVSFCFDNNILLIHDFPYVDMVFGDYQAPSILTQKGGMEVGVELYSCSKSFHMGGFRMGWAIGNQDAISALAQAKSAIDFNQYLGIQRAAIQAIKQPQEQRQHDAEIFESRCQALVQHLNANGWQAPMPKASMYVWTRLPEGLSNSFEFCVNLAKTTGVCLAPGKGFGVNGEGFVRFALVREETVLAEAVQKIRAYL